MRVPRDRKAWQLNANLYTRANIEFCLRRVQELALPFVIMLSILPPNLFWGFAPMNGKPGLQSSITISSGVPFLGTSNTWVHKVKALDSRSGGERDAVRCRHSVGNI